MEVFLRSSAACIVLDDLGRGWVRELDLCMLVLSNLLCNMGELGTGSST